VNEQERRQRRAARNRKIGAISLSAALAVAVALLVVNTLDLTDRGKETNKVAGQPVTLPSEPGVYLFDLETKQATRVPEFFPSQLWGRSPESIVSPDGSMVAYAGTDTDGRDLVYVADINGTDTRALEKTATGPLPQLPRGCLVCRSRPTARRSCIRYDPMAASAAKLTSLWATCSSWTSRPGRRGS